MTALYIHTTPIEVARILADGRVTAAEGTVLERIGTALVAEGQALIALGRRAQRERVVALPDSRQGGGW